MIADYVLPGSVVLLKFIFRLYLGQAVTRVDLFKALLNFPVDLAFLAISFSAIILTYMQARSSNALSTKEALGVFVMFIVSAAVVTLCTKRSDNAFVGDRNIAAIGWVVPAYFISIAAVLFTIIAWGPN